MEPDIGAVEDHQDGCRSAVIETLCGIDQGTLAGAALGVDPQSFTSDDAVITRVMDGALVLAMKMLVSSEFKDLSRGEILLIAINTAMVWERES